MKSAITHQIQQQLRACQAVCFASIALSQILVYIHRWWLETSIFGCPKGLVNLPTRLVQECAPLVPLHMSCLPDILTNLRDMVLPEKMNDNYR
jgi:uncharacterized membrane protein YhdT